MRLLIVTICKDEAATIEELVARIPEEVEGITRRDVLLIDDGSSDETVQLAKAAGAMVLSDGVNRGLATRFREAADFALTHGYDLMVNIDGDLQFAPEDIPQFVAPIMAGQADFVAADRFTDPATGEERRPENMPAVKYYGNKLGAYIVSKLSNQAFRDVTCGFRSYNRDALYALNINGKHTYTQESFQMLAAKGLRIATVPVVVKYFKDRQSRVVTSIPKYAMTSAVNILRAFRDFAPLRFFIVLGSIPFVLGLLAVIGLGIYWLQTGSFSPYKFVGFAGIYMISLGIFLYALGLLADMQVRILNNQEKTYEALRRLAHNDTTKQ